MIAFVYAQCGCRTRNAEKCPGSVTDADCLDSRFARPGSVPSPTQNCHVWVGLSALTDISPPVHDIAIPRDAWQPVVSAPV
jgi:hypothetical protein